MAYVLLVVSWAKLIHFASEEPAMNRSCTLRKENREYKTDIGGFILLCAARSRYLTTKRA